MNRLFSRAERSPKLDSRDRRIVLAVTLLYVVLTLLNLGTLSFPEETWSPKAGERVVLDFGGPVEFDFGHT